MDNKTKQPTTADALSTVSRRESQESSNNEHDDEPTNIASKANPNPMQLTRTVSSGPPYTIFSARTKLFIVWSVSISSLISPFGATTFYPALNTLARELDVTPSLINLALTTYMVLSPATSLFRRTCS